MRWPTKSAWRAGVWSLALLVVAGCARQGDVVVDAHVGRVDVAADAGFVAVTWTTPGPGAAGGFAVVRRDAGADGCAAISQAEGRVVARVSDQRRSYVDLDVEAGGAYCYAVLGDVGVRDVAVFQVDWSSVARPAAPRPPAETDPDAPGDVVVVVLDERGGALTGARVTWVGRASDTGEFAVVSARSDDRGVARFDPDAGAFGGAFVADESLLFVEPQGAGGTAIQLRRVGGFGLPGTITIDPREPGTVELDLVITNDGDADNHLLQLLPEDGPNVLGIGFDASALPTRVRVTQGAWTAVVSGYRYADDVGTHIWFDVAADRDGLSALDTRAAPSVTLVPRGSLATSATVVSLFTCPLAQRPGLTIANRYCLGDAELLLTPQRYRFEAQLRARVGTVDWIYTLETGERDVAGGASRQQLDLGGGARLDAALEPSTAAGGEPEVTLRARVHDAHGNVLRSVVRREDGVSVEAPAIVRLIGAEGFVVSEQVLAGDALDGWTIALPDGAGAGGFGLEVSYPIGPLASAPLRAVLDVARP